MIPTPFDDIPLFDSTVIQLIDAYAKNVLKHHFTYWLFAWNLTDDIENSFLTACKTSGQVDTVKYFV